MRRTQTESVAMGLGLVSLALMLGALGFQFFARIPPCELCWWQRYPHIAAIVVGLIGGGAVSGGLLPRSLAMPIAILTALLVAASGVIGVYHAGVEWHWWIGPSSCTGGMTSITGPLDLNAPVVMCDHAAWRMFGLSLAGYNAIVSLAAAFLGFIFVARAGRR